MKPMKESTRRIFDYIKEHEGLTTKEVAANLSEITGEEITPQAVTGSFNSFVKKGWAYREEELVPGDKIKRLYFTDEGKSVDIDALCSEEVDA